jgi:hypothetical protein
MLAADNSAFRELLEEIHVFESKIVQEGLNTSTKRLLHARRQLSKDLEPQQVRTLAGGLQRHSPRCRNTYIHHDSSAQARAGCVDAAGMEEHVGGGCGSGSGEQEWCIRPPSYPLASAGPSRVLHAVSLLSACMALHR